MTDGSKHHTVQVDGAEQAGVSAEVITLAGSAARASLRAESGQLPRGSRAALVDAVLELPEVQQADHLAVNLPLGDAESLQRLQERTSEMTVRAAGSTALVDADLPPEVGPPATSPPEENNNAT